MICMRNYIVDHVNKSKKWRDQQKFAGFYRNWIRCASSTQPSAAQTPSCCCHCHRVDSDRVNLCIEKRCIHGSVCTVSTLNAAILSRKSFPPRFPESIPPQFRRPPANTTDALRNSPFFLLLLVRLSLADTMVKRLLFSVCFCLNSCPLLVHGACLMGVPCQK